MSWDERVITFMAGFLSRENGIKMYCEKRLWSPQGEGRRRIIMCFNFHVVSEKGQTLIFVLRQKSYGEVNKLLSFFLSPCSHFLPWIGGGSAEP